MAEPFESEPKNADVLIHLKSRGPQEQVESLFPSWEEQPAKANDLDLYESGWSPYFPLFEPETDVIQEWYKSLFDLPRWEEHRHRVLAHRAVHPLVHNVSWELDSPTAFLTFHWKKDNEKLCESLVRYGRFDGNLLIDDPEQLASVRAWATETGAKPLVLLDHSKDSQVGVAELRNVPKHLTIAHAVPSDLESLQTVYESSMSDEALAWSRGYSNALAAMARDLHTSIDFLDLAPRRDTIHVNTGNAKDCRSQLLDKIDKLEDADVLIILAHNSNGRLIFGDGTTCKMDELVLARGKVWVVSCSTLNYLTPRPMLRMGTSTTLSYEEGIAVVRRAVTTMGHQEVTCRHLLKAMLDDGNMRSKASLANPSSILVGVVESKNVVELRLYV